MLFFYGSKAPLLASERLNTATCPHCDNQGTLVNSVFGRYAHLFWIPLFPVGKPGITECTHCKYAMREKEMPEDVKREVFNLKETAKRPLWHFLGLGIIGFLFGIPLLFALAGGIMALFS